MRGQDGTNTSSRCERVQGADARSCSRRSLLLVCLRLSCLGGYNLPPPQNTANLSLSAQEVSVYIYFDRQFMWQLV